MLAEQVRRSLRAPMKIAGQEIVLTASIGIVVYDGTQATAQDLLREAEIAMFRAKRVGRRPHRDLQSRRCAPRTRAAAARERSAARRSSASRSWCSTSRSCGLPPNQLAGFEALLRWEHPTRGRLGAEDFIPLAEESDLIVKLGCYVLGQALEEAVRWHKVLPRDRDPLFVSVNVSSRQLFRQDMVQEIRHILAREAVPKGTLRLEITESLVMENPERAVEILSWLKTSAPSLALDDFGTGYSSLCYLHQFPFDTIKVDRSLVRDSGLNGSTPLILRSVVALAHELGKKVVAEGVETAADASLSPLDRLRVRPGLLLRRADGGQGRGRSSRRSRQPSPAQGARESARPTGA